MITQRKLKEFFFYDEETGLFTRIKNASKGKAKAGDIIGLTPNHSGGYVTVSVDGGRYLAHRLAWIYMTGKEPADQIDHVNGNRSDNRRANLREADNSKNQQNIYKAKSHNKVGLLGVSRNKKRWKAEIRAEGKRIHIGTYSTPKEAHFAYLEEKKRVHIDGGNK